jgi:hypothetical protein
MELPLVLERRRLRDLVGNELLEVLFTTESHSLVSSSVRAPARE